MKDSFQKDF